jgi:hypothetical protein
MRNRRPLPPGNIPMVTETHHKLALELRMSGEVLIERPTPEAFNRLSKMLAALCNAGLTGVDIDLASSTMCLICDRYERVGKIGVSQIETKQLRTALDGIDRQLPRIPVNKFKHAVTEVALYCASIGA